MFLPPFVCCAVGSSVLYTTRTINQPMNHRHAHAQQQQEEIDYTRLDPIKPHTMTTHLHYMDHGMQHKGYTVQYQHRTSLDHNRIVLGLDSHDRTLNAQLF